MSRSVEGMHTVSKTGTEVLFSNLREIPVSSLSSRTGSESVASEVRAVEGVRPYPKPTREVAASQLGALPIFSLKRG